MANVIHPKLLLKSDSNTWKGKVPACWLVSNSVVDNLQMFRECLGQAAMSLGYKLFLAFCAGYQVD